MKFCSPVFPLPLCNIEKRAGGGERAGVEIEFNVYTLHDAEVGVYLFDIARMFAYPARTIFPTLSFFYGEILSFSPFPTSQQIQSLISQSSYHLYLAPATLFIFQQLPVHILKSSFFLLSSSHTNTPARIERKSLFNS